MRNFRAFIFALALSGPAFADDQALAMTSLVVGPFLVPLLGLWIASRIRSRSGRHETRQWVTVISVLSFFLAFSHFGHQAMSARGGEVYVALIALLGAFGGAIPALLGITLARLTHLPPLR